MIRETRCRISDLVGEILYVDLLPLVDVVIRKHKAFLHSPAARRIEALLASGNARLVKNLRLDIVNGVAGVNFEGDGCLDGDLHDAK